MRFFIIFLCLAVFVFVKTAECANNFPELDADTRNNQLESLLAVDVGAEEHENLSQRQVRQFGFGRRGFGGGGFGRRGFGGFGRRGFGGGGFGRRGFGGFGRRGFFG